jgi:hypothetical protein
MCAKVGLKLWKNIGCAYSLTACWGEYLDLRENKCVGLTGGWRKSHMEELRNFFSLPNILGGEISDDYMNFASRI